MENEVSLLVPVLGRINPVHILQSYFLNAILI